MTEDRDEGRPVSPLGHGMEIVKLPRCSRCNLSYVSGKSTSALKLTYCSFLCELGDLGFSMTGLENMQLIKKIAAEPNEPAPEPVAVD